MYGIVLSNEALVPRMMVFMTTMVLMTMAVFMTTMALITTMVLMTMMVLIISAPRRDMLTRNNAVSVSTC